MNLLEQQAANRRRTWAVIAAFIVLLALLGAGFDFFLVGNGVTYLPFATIAAVSIGSLQAWWGLRHGDTSILKSTDARRVEECIQNAATDDDRLRYRQFENIVEEMAIASGLPKPQAYVIPDPDPNAFATGRDPDHASIAVTDGLLRSLDREELQGVVAHEMGHIRNLDIRLMTVVAALVGAILLLADWSMRSMRFGGRAGVRRGGGKGKGAGVAILVFVAIWLIAAVVAPLVGRLLAMALSRRREYLADATGAELTRNPQGLARALEKIEGFAGPTERVKRGTAHLCITDPLGLQVNSREGRWANLWGTHPPMARRIAALREMAYQAQSQPLPGSGPASSTQTPPR
jgi:heat shock protein HtpX